MHSLLTFGVLLPSIVCVLAGCSGQANSPQRQQTPDATRASNTESTRVNLDEIFPPGPGRDLVLNNCTSCHTFVPIVILQMTKEAWERNSRDHRERVTALGDADFRVLYEYVAAHFNPDKPVPKLPKDLLDTWTSY